MTFCIAWGMAGESSQKLIILCIRVDNVCTQNMHFSMSYAQMTTWKIVWILQNRQIVAYVPHPMESSFSYTFRLTDRHTHTPLHSRNAELFHFFIRNICPNSVIWDYGYDSDPDQLYHIMTFWPLVIRNLSKWNLNLVAFSPAVSASSVYIMVRIFVQASLTLQIILAVPTSFHAKAPECKRSPGRRDIYNAFVQQCMTDESVQGNTVTRQNVKSHVGINLPAALRWKPNPIFP